ncbi:MAG: hypothetical protein FWE38_04510 [Firmicutes bacterium]|nr:hypothetical protein [Bacillota bacterium]
MDSNQKMKGYIGLAIRAGKVVFGADNIIEWRKKNYGIIMCDSASDNTKKRIHDFAASRNLSVHVLPPGLSLVELVHREKVKVIAFTNKSLYTSTVGSMPV